MPRRRLILFGLSGADWAFLGPLLDAGRLPTLARLVESGASGDLGSPAPAQPVAAWTTLATGCLADRHGITAPLVPRPDGAGVAPPGHDAWRSPAFWQTLEAAGHHTATIGWPATAPATSWPGIHLDPRFPLANGAAFETWALAPGCVSPTPLRPVLRELRLHPTELLLEQVLALAPGLAALDQERDRRLAPLAVALARATSLHAAATHLAEHTAWQVMAVHHDLLAVLREDVSAAGLADDPAFGPVPAGAAALLDMMLQRLIDLAGPNAEVLVASPYGLAGARMRPGAGMFAWAGPGIPADRLLHGVGTQDLAPTLLARFGLAANADGTPVPDLAPAATPHRTLIPPPPPPTAPAHPDPGTVPAAAHAAILAATRAARLHRAEAQQARGTPAAAAATLEALLADHPGDTTALVRLAECMAATGQFRRLRPLAAALLAAAPNDPVGRVAHAAACWAEGDDASADATLAALPPVVPAPLLTLLGGLALRRGRPAEARRHFAAALAADPLLAAAAHGLGVALAATGDGPGAEAALRHSLAIAFRQPAVHRDLGRLLTASGRTAEAALHVARGMLPG